MRRLYTQPCFRYNTHVELFTFLFVPFFCVLWRTLPSIIGSARVRPVVMGLVCGCLLLPPLVLFTPIVNASGFGLSRALSALLDMTGLLPFAGLLFFGLFRLLRLLPECEAADFTPPFIVPLSAAKALSWEETGNPLYALLPPLLWTSLCVCFSLAVTLGAAKGATALRRVLAGLVLVVSPLAAAFSWWAFFAQKTLYACLALGFVLSLTAAALVCKCLGVFSVNRECEKIVYGTYDNGGKNA